jgi:hypothetical protein
VLSNHSTNIGEKIQMLHYLNFSESSNQGNGNNLGSSKCVQCGGQFLVPYWRNVVAGCYKFFSSVL